MVDFTIEPRNPQVNESVGGFADDLAEALEIVFPMDTENAILRWHSIEVPLNYKYDISVIIEDVVWMLERCIGEPKNEFDVVFGSNTFNVGWKVQADVDSVVVSATWNSVVGDFEADLNQTPTMEVSRTHFIHQWIGLLNKTLEAFDMTSIRIHDDDLLKRTRALCGSDVGVPPEK